MSLFRETDNFIWDSSGVLGSGATATVFHGFDKRTGEAVAVKCFNNPNAEPIYIQKRIREFEMLEKLNHENIVKLIAIEKEYETKDFVLVMELCRGNCLLDILRDGRHYNGFEDKEFLTIVKHVTAAVKHMREHKVAHRDLKPGNIVKHIGNDGQAIYKVADFGSARELDDGQEFVSVCGTRAYLHPNIFAKHFLQKHKVCDANVDLWSIGVTFYHLATGSLPFRTFKPADHEKMYQIISQKHSGIISGVQEVKNGEIKWSSSLPKNCALSPFLRTLVEILLVRLLEYEKSKMWSFEEFFDYVELLLSHKPIQIVYANTIQESLHYLLPTTTLEQLKAIVLKEANIAVENQVYLWNGEELSELKSLDIMSKAPLFVVDRSSQEVKSVNLDNFSIAVPDFEQQHSNLLVLVKYWQTNAYSLKKAVLKSSQQTKMIHLTVSEIEKFLESKVRVNLKNKHLTEVIFNSLKQQFEHLSNINAFILELNRLCVESRNENSDELIVKARSKFHSLSIKWNEIDNHFAQVEEKIRLLKGEWIEEECNWDTICATAEHHCCSMQEMYRLIEVHEIASVTVPGVKRLIALDKKRFKNTFLTLCDLLEKTCVPLRLNVCNQFEDWYPKIFIAIQFCEWVSKLLSDFTEQSVELQRCFTAVHEQQKDILKAVKEVVEMEKVKKTTINNLLRKELTGTDECHERLSALITQNRFLVSTLQSFEMSQDYNGA